MTILLLGRRQDKAKSAHKVSLLRHSPPTSAFLLLPLLLQNGRGAERAEGSFLQIGPESAFAGAQDVDPECAGPTSTAGQHRRFILRGQALHAQPNPLESGRGNRGLMHNMEGFRMASSFEDKEVAMWIAIGIAVAVLVIVFAMYNGLVGKRNQVENAFSSIDTLLKKRYDLIPNLVAAVRQYMQHEAGTLTEITAMRAKAVSGTLSQDEAVDLNNRMGSALRGIMVAVENYPQLRATENFQQLQRSLNEVEEQISAARRAFNASVTDFNNAVQMFPTNMMAGMMGLQPRKWFEVPEAERQNPSVKDLFKS